MKFQNIEFEKTLSPFVKSIMVFENNDPNIKTNLPFFADGFPGLMFHETPNGLYVNPHKKRMSSLFLYGQTIEPIEIEIDGNYQIIIFQLYPFILKSLFNIKPKSINDNCYDLDSENIQIENNILANLSLKKDLNSRINLLISYIEKLIELKRKNIDNSISIAIKKIVTSKGKHNLLEIANEINITKRTFERRFLLETGLLPKQFSKIIQFQNSLTQLSIKDYTTLTDVVYENGFADQSHFIKVFKSFTGKTPKQYVKHQDD